MSAHPGRYRTIELLRGSLVALAILVAGQASLGFLGWWNPLSTMGLLLAVSLGCVLWAVRVQMFSLQRPIFAGWSVWEAGLLTALAAAFISRIWAAAGSNSFLYDAISYHLHFAATWMHSGQLEIVPTVFGDLGPAYGASNVELVSHALMSVFHSGYLAQAAQLPFLFIGLIALVAAVRELGGTLAGALGGALAFVLLPEVWGQSTNAMVDVALASMLLATLPFLLRLSKNPTTADFGSLALAVGLFLGTKTLALLFGLPLLAAGCWILWTHRCRIPGLVATLGRSVGFLFIVIATGGFWYLRNWIEAGNPIFPVEVQIGSFTLFEGLYTADIMRAWSKHYSVFDLDAFARVFLSAGAGFVFAGLAALFLRFRKAEFSLAALLLLIAWFVIPYQRARFMLPFDAVLAVSMGALSHLPKNRRIASILLGIATASSLLLWPDWERFGVVFAGVIGLFLPRVETHFSLRPVAWGALALLIIMLGLGFSTYRERDPSYRVTSDLDASWAWVHENVSGAHFAYAGVNLPFPLSGRDLQNQVSYANVNLGPKARVHDFGYTENTSTAEPGIYRREASYSVWLQNLRELQIDRLFVSSLFPIVAKNIEADAEGFPIERAWADAHPGVFRPIYENESVRIYSVDTLAEPTRN
jgi:hypothetical protein